MFVQLLIFSNIYTLYYFSRSVFPDHAFGDRRVEGICVHIDALHTVLIYTCVDLSLKILRDDNACPGACQVIKWYTYTHVAVLYM